MMDYSDGRGLEVENQYVDETESSRVVGYPDFRKLIEVGGHLKAASRRLLVTCSRNQGSLVRPCASSGKMRVYLGAFAKALAITSAAAGTCYGILGEIRGSVMEHILLALRNREQPVRVVNDAIR